MGIYSVQCAVRQSKQGKIEIFTNIVIVIVIVIVIPHF